MDFSCYRFSFIGLWYLEGINMKIDWFWFVLGIAWIIMGIVFFIFSKDLWMVIIMIFVGIINLLKSYFQDRMSFKKLFKRK